MKVVDNHFLALFISLDFLKQARDSIHTNPISLRLRAAYLLVSALVPELPTHHHHINEHIHSNINE